MKTYMLKKVLVSMQLVMNSAPMGSKSSLIEAHLTPDTFCGRFSPDALRRTVTHQWPKQAERRCAVPRFRSL